MRHAAIAMLALALMVSGLAHAHAARIEEHAYVAAEYVSSCAPPFVPAQAPRVNDVCFPLLRGETSYTVSADDAQLVPVGGELSVITTTTSGTTIERIAFCDQAQGTVAWPSTVRAVVLNVDLGSPGACAFATAGMLRLEAHPD